MGIYVYKPNEEDFDSLGLVGELLATKCEHDEAANGFSDLTIVHPIDPGGKWRALVVGNIVKAPTQVRETPEIDMSNPNAPLRKITVEKWFVKPGATKDKRYLWTQSAKGRKMKLLPGNLKVTVVQNSPVGKTRKKAKTKYGTGWIEDEALTYEVTQSVPDTNTGIEVAQSPYKTKDQLFFVDKVKMDLNSVTVQAKHIFYKLAKNAITYNAPSCSACAAVAGILGTCLYGHEFEGFTDMGDVRYAIDWRTWNSVKALLDPEAGLISRWGGQLVRDNYELHVLRKAGKNRGVRIEYGKNLTGVDYDEDISEVYTRIIPIGTTKDGKRLYLDGTIWVDSPRINDYPEPSILIIECGDCVVSKNMTTAQARAEMRRQAQQMLDDGCDLPTVSIKVKFQALGQAEGYAQFRDLEKAYLFDTVLVGLRSRLGFDVTAEVMRVKTDCLTGEPLEMDIACLRKTQAKIATFQIPGGVSGTKLYFGSVGPGALGDEIIETRHIQAGSIVAELIQTGAISAEKLDATSVSAFVLDAVKARIQKLATEEVTTDELYAALAQIALAQITTANIERANINWASINTLTAQIATLASAEIGSADIDWARIKDLVAGSAIFTEGVGGVLYMERLSVSDANIIGMSANKITAGTINAEDIEVINLKAANITVGTINGQQIAPGAIGPGHIVDGAITGSKIDLGAVAASKLNITQHIIY